MSNPASHSARDLAGRFGLRVSGDGDAQVSGAATLARAQRHQLAFLANPRYRSQLQQTQAGIVVYDVNTFALLGTVAVPGQRPRVPRPEPPRPRR